MRLVLAELWWCTLQVCMRRARVTDQAWLWLCLQPLTPVRKKKIFMTPMSTMTLPAARPARQCKLKHYFPDLLIFKSSLPNRKPRIFFFFAQLPSSYFTSYKGISLMKTAYFSKASWCTSFRKLEVSGASVTSAVQVYASHWRKSRGWEVCMCTSW